VLTPDDIHVGDEVFTYNYRGREEKAVVSKVSRVWITAATIAMYPRELRFRLDDQTDGSKIGVPPHFRTTAQRERAVRLADALEVLKEHDLARRFSKPCSDDLLLAVAGFLTAWDVEH
jgi:hypothetical protein